MTLIAIATHRDRAEIATDTLTYTHTATRMGHQSKVLPLPHLDAAIVAQGSTGFEARWHVQALQLARHSTSFDDLAARAQEHLQATWEALDFDVLAENTLTGRATRVADTVVFLVGYSAARGRWVATAHASDVDFAPLELHGLHAMPSPLRHRPSEVEQRRLRAHLRQVAPEGEEDLADVIVDKLAARAPLDPPRRPEQWAQLAQTIRRDRALAPLASGLKTYVGGDVTLTTLRRGQVSQRRVHTFDDAGPEFATMMAGSLHPIGQAGPCDCGSGHRARDCCLAFLDGQPCPCRSGRPFEACCSIDAELQAAQQRDGAALAG